MILSYTFFQNAIMVSLLIAILCPLIGIFLILRRYAMIGDTLAHTSLAGVAGGLLLQINPVLGAFLFTAFSGALIEFLRSYFRRYTELILSVVLAIGVGIALTIISSGSLKANSNSFLFGSVLTVTQGDVWMALGLGVTAVVAMVALYDRLIYITFDEDAARLAGVPVKWINYAFSILVAAAIAISIRMVGVLVIGSLIALPAATAIQLNRGFLITLIWSVAFSVFNLLAGLFLAYVLDVAPGGFTALLSAVTLLLVLTFQTIARRLRVRKAGGSDTTDKPR
jgi:zinc transport system permease protein